MRELLKHSIGCDLEYFQTFEMHNFQAGTQKGCIMEQYML